MAFEVNKVVTGSVMLFILWGIATPASIYWLVEYWHRREHTAIHKRQPKFVLLFGILCIIFLALRQPMIIIQHSFHSDPSHLFHWIDLVLNPLLHLCVFAVVVRFYFLHYSIRWVKSCRNDLWKQHLGNQQHSHNWILRNRATWGNALWMCRIFIPYSLIIEIFLVVLNDMHMFGGETVSSVIDAFIFVIDFFFVTILTRNTPAFADHFKIISEMKWVIMVGAAALLVYVAVIALEMVGLPLYPVIVAETMAQSAAFFFVFLVNTYWVIHGSGVEIKKTNAPNLSAALTPHSSNDMTVTDVLADKQAFQSFMGHLFQEFSSENLIALVEFTQYQHFAERLSATEYDMADSPRSGNDDHKQDLVYTKTKNRDFTELSMENALRSRSVSVETSHCGTNVILYKGIPQSSIVYADHLSLADKVVQLIRKYILIGSEFELNISGPTRKKLKRLNEKLTAETANDIDDTTLATCFDRVISELIRLMLASFDRWAETAALMIGKSQRGGAFFKLF